MSLTVLNSKELCACNNRPCDGICRENHTVSGNIHCFSLFVKNDIIANLPNNSDLENH